MSIIGYWFRVLRLGQPGAGVFNDCDPEGSHVDKEFVGQGSGHRDWVHEVLQKNDLAGVFLREPGQDVTKRVRHAVRAGLAKNPDDVGFTDDLQQVGIDLRGRIGIDRHVRLERGVVLRRFIATFGDIVHHGLAAEGPGDDFIGDLFDQGLTSRSNDTVGRPDHERVAPIDGELRHIMGVPLLLPGIGRTPHSGLDVVVRDDGKQPRVFSLPVDPRSRMRDVHRLVGVEGQVDHRELPGDTTDQRRRTDGALVSAGHVKGTSRVAEVELNVDAKELDTRGTSSSCHI